MFTEAPQWVGRAKRKVKIAVSKKSEVKKKKNRIRRRRRRRRREAFYNHLESTEGERNLPGGRRVDAWASCWDPADQAG